MEKLKVVLVTVNDSLYAPLYIENTLDSLREDERIRCSKVYVLEVVRGNSLRKLIRQRLKIYGPAQMLLFLLIIAKTRLFALLGRYISLKRPYSIQRVARQHQVELAHISSVNAPEFIQQLREDGVDVLISIGIPQKFKAAALQAVPYPLNVHSSLLPKYAGVMGLFWAVLHGEETVGVSLFTMDEDFDSGKLLGQITFPVDGMNSLHQLYMKAIEFGSQLIVDVLRQIAGGDVMEHPQNAAERSYFSFPGEAERREFFRRGFRFFRLRDIWHV